MPQIHEFVLPEVPQIQEFALPEVPQIQGFTSAKLSQSQSTTGNTETEKVRKKWLVDSYLNAVVSSRTLRNCE